MSLQKDSNFGQTDSNSREITLDVELLESSFAKIRPRLSSFAASFYQVLFILHPETKPLFENTDMEAQEQKLAESLVLVVVNLRKLGFLTQALKDLATRHIQYGILPKHYPLVGNALLTTFENYLGSDWKPEVKKAWKDAYNLISSIMLEGVKSSESKVIRLDRTNEGKSAETPIVARENENYSQEIKKSSNLPAQAAEDKSSSKEENQGEITLDVELLESSFAKIRPRLSSFAASFYQVLFILHPETKPLFENIDMKAQEQKLAESLVLVVLNLRKLGFLTQALQDLGRRHVQYGTFAEHYPLVGNAILTTFRYYLGSDWTPEVKKAWKDAYNLISSIMLEGARSPESNVISEKRSTTSKYPEKSVLARENKKSPRKVGTNPNLPAQVVQNKSWSQKDPEIAQKNANYAEIPLNIELLEKSFAQIRPRLSNFSASFYRNLFIIYPEIKPLFANTDMKAQEQKLVDSLILVILNLRQPNLWTQALRDLGARHVNYGTFAEHYPLVGNVLLTTFRQYLQSDWTPEVRKAWKDAYNLISKTMLEGAENVPLNVIDDNRSTQRQLREKPTVAQKNKNYPRKIKKNPNLSAQSNHNEFYENLLAAILIISSLIVILFILL